MDDNARPHRANIVDECLQSEDITRIDWPAYSPDLNPIEHKDKQWDWTAECQTVFELLKNKLITKPVLQLYDAKLPLHAFCDASLNAIGAILKQPDNSGTLHPVSYHSRNLRDYEKNYCITELECLAIVDALDKFYYLHGKKFVIHTNHAALVWLKNVKNLKGRLFFVGL
ncbi:transposon Ty3-I Gag-Pol polyprotein [Trichonephila clavipes]|uniref:Transposon Ty3-I Gag-Pol polyprotein n=1 Tax=Trichonephila clavipes TaxID=2585209 RepID=A0A8X6VCI1_TRICX|nr:transposon Ty3-I Gag-Pol polyprotein [Trichonephila clavipes]